MSSKWQESSLADEKSFANDQIAALGNAILIFVTFLISVPGIIMPMTRGWLKLSGYMTVVCGLFTLIIGLTIWFETLKTRRVLSDIWNVLPSTSQSLLQQKVCGFSSYVQYVPLC